MKQMKQKSRGKGPRKQNLGQRELISHPPQVNGVELRHSVTLRFVSNAAVNHAITFQNLLDTMIVAATATSAFDVFQAVKVRRVRMWSMPAIGGASSVSVEFSGITAGVIGDQQIHTDTSMGVQPAHVDARPNARSLAADFQLSSSAVAFSLRAPAAGTVIDVELSFRGQFAAAVATQNNAAGATAGAFYLRGLDGLATATSVFVPEYAAGQN